MNDFTRDDEGQKAVRSAVIGPGFYGTYSLEGRYVYIDKGQLATVLQRKFAVDSVIQRPNGCACFVEEKIVRWPGREYTAVALETKSCTVPGHESDGWMVYGKADWLNYAMCQENGNVLLHVIDFPALKEKFWPEEETFPLDIQRKKNRTACRIVPIEWIKGRGIGIYTRMVYATPEGAEIVRAYNRDREAA